MEPRSFPLPPSDPICALCSKPVRSGGYLVSPTGETFHIRCRSWDLQLAALEQHDRARVAIGRARELVEETTSRRQRGHSRREIVPVQSCPVCRGSATLTDWRPALEWMSVEDCRCRGFFVWTRLLDDGRLARLTPEDRATLSERIRTLRATGEAWLSTRDRTVMGALILREDRPDRPR